MSPSNTFDSVLGGITPETPSESLGPSTTISGILHRHAMLNPESLALLAPGRTPMTYGELWRQTCTLGAMLRERQVRRADRVGLLMGNGPELASALLGIAASATCMPLNPDSRQNELLRAIQEAVLSCVVCGADTHPAVEAAARTAGIPLIRIEPARGGVAGALGLDSFGALRAPAPDGSEPATPHDVALLLLTSGTSAWPKLVALTQASLVESAAHLVDRLDLRRTDRCLNVSPLFHSQGVRGALLTSLFAGSSVICAPAFQTESFIDWLHSLQPTWYTASPTVQQGIVGVCLSRGREELRHHLRFIRSTSSALPPATLLQLESLLHTPVIESYGMTECSDICINPLPPGERRVGSVGLPTRIQLQIVDEAGRSCAAGAEGLIMIRGDQVIRGYEGHHAANETAFADGWFQTGDIGRQDADGYVYITGRTSDVVNRGGEKVLPREVDDALLEHPAVVEAVAYGIPHPTLGEDLVAAVVRKPGHAVDESELRQFLFARLTPSKIPSSIVFADGIPKGANGKIQRNRLFAQIADQVRSAHVEPRDPTEASIATVFRDVLRQDRVGVHDNFFALGGDSLSGSRAVVRINHDHGVTLAATTLFLHPTVADLATRLVAVKSQVQIEERQAEAEIAAMTDEVVLRLLAQEELDSKPGGAIPARRDGLPRGGER